MDPKHIIYLAFLLVNSDAFAQNSTKISPYLLDSFVEGFLYYQGKPPQAAKFNYHLVGQEVVMDFDGKKVPVNNFPNLDSVRIGEYNFVLKDGIFYELLIPGEVQLILEYRYTSQEEAKEGLYGTKTHTQGVVIANRPLRPNDFYSSEWQQGYALIDRSEFYISKDGEWTKFGNSNQLGQIFKEKKKEIKEYASTHKIDFRNRKDVKEVVAFTLE